MENGQNYKLEKSEKKNPNIKRDDKIIKFDDIEIEELEFHQYKRPFSINNIDINKIVVSSKITFRRQDFKYFIGYKLLCTFHPKRSRDFDKAKCMYFLIKEGEKI